MLRIEDRLIVSVDKFHLNKTAGITIGWNSDICYDNIPNDYLTISFLENNDSIVWEVNPHYIQTDSLCYLKVNESNPNIHGINPNDIIRISHNSLDIELTVDELLNEIDDGCKSEYIAVKWLLAHRQFRDTNFCHGYDFMEDKALKSFIYRHRSGKSFWTKMGEPQLVILDNATTMMRDNTVTRFSNRETAASSYGIKVQFYKITSSSYQERKVKEEYFHIGDINYIMKPVIVTTEWGAGHVMLKKRNNSVDVMFPKPIMYVETLHNLDSLARFSSNVITFRQMDRSFPITNNLFFPTFSTYLNQDVCSIVFDNSYVTCDDDTISAQHRFLPHIDKHLSKINPDVDLRLGILDFGYYLSFITLPFVAFLVCCLLIFFFDVRNIRVSKSNTALSLRWYALLILLIAFAYSVCRVLIAIKLSYTYPYFDKLAGIIPISVSAFLLLVFNLSLLFNHEVLAPSNLEKKDQPRYLKLHRKWWALIASVILWFGICYCMAHMDKTNNAPFIESYLPTENATLSPLCNLNPRGWSDMNAMNDLHRNVPFTLLLVNLSTLFLLILLNVEKLKILIKSLIDRIIVRINSLIDRITIRKEKTYSTSTKSFRRCFFWFIETVFMAVPITLCSILLGNFSTALITLLLIPMFSLSLSHIPIDKDEGVSWEFVIMAVLSAFVFLVSAVGFGDGDKGYITNVLGVFGLVLCMYYISYKHPVEEKKHKVNKFVPYAVILALLMGVLVLFSEITSSNSDIYKRHNQRAGYNFNYNEYMATGYRSTLNNSEFMHVVTHYMFNSNCTDPLSPEIHPLHASVSTGQSPVVLNDVSVPGAFLGAFGRTAYIPYVGLAFILLVLVLYNTFSNDSDYYDRYSVISRRDTCRVLAALMWIGTTLYLFFSYINVPFIAFTGRLNPGLGVDAVGEALESAVLLAFMLVTKLEKE